ncbi:MAG: dTDP-4-dehydrorhamnose 3,5-epimerase [Pseudomonadota bacterium]
MEVQELGLPGVKLIKPRVFGDARGYFLETWNRERYGAAGIDVDFVQTNVSRSARGVLRGLHYQWPNPQGKLVYVTEGSVFDVAVDIRQGSPTYGQWVGASLTAESGHQLYVPPGFAHGFCVTSEWTTFCYLCTALYDAEADAGVRWNDPAIGVDWPIVDPSLSAKDEQAPLLADVAPDRLPAA